MIAKHSTEGIIFKELQKENNDLKNKIKELTEEYAETLQKIREINECNEYGNPSVNKRKISEICTDTRYRLCIDDNKIIELSTDNQSNR